METFEFIIGLPLLINKIENDWNFSIKWCSKAFWPKNYYQLTELDKKVSSLEFHLNWVSISNEQQKKSRLNYDVWETHK